MKTIKLTKEGKANKKKLYDWLYEQDILEQFIENNLIFSKTLTEDNINDTYNNDPIKSICLAFNWAKTKQGFEFWNETENNWRTHFLSQKYKKLK